MAASDPAEEVEIRCCSNAAGPVGQQLLTGQKDYLPRLGRAWLVEEGRRPQPGALALAPHPPSSPTRA